VVDDRTVEERVVEAIGLDLDLNAGLDAHDTLLYRRPRAVMPEDCPLLCVWWDSKDIDFLTTQKFHYSLAIGVSWQEETVEEAQTLMRDDVIARSLIRNIHKCEKRIEHIAINGWDIAPAWELLPQGTEYTRMEEGLVEGYAFVVQVAVSED
jgi:hypothetical protein